MIKIYNKTKTKEFQRVSEIIDNSLVIVENTTQEDLKEIASLTKLRIRDVKHVLDEFEIPRVEKFEDTVIIFLRTPEESTSGLDTETLTIIYTKKNLILLSPDKNNNITNIIKEGLVSVTKNKTGILFEILDSIANDFNKKIEELNYKVLTQRRDLKKINQKVIEQLIMLEEVLNQYQGVLNPTINLIEKISHDQEYIKISREQKHDFHDLVIAFQQSLDNCALTTRSIKNLTESYQILFTNNLNKTLKLFTSLTVILTIPTIIASFWGMNVPVPLENDADGFTTIALGTFLASILAVIIFIYKRWL